MVMLPEEEHDKVLIVPSEVFQDLFLKAGKRFDTIAPLGPYPEMIGVRWETNNTIYTWFVKNLRKVYNDHYKSIVDLELESKA